MGRNPGTVSNALRGERGVGTELLLAFAKALDSSTDWLLKGGVYLRDDEPAPVVTVVSDDRLSLLETVQRWPGRWIAEDVATAVLTVVPDLKRGWRKDLEATRRCRMLGKIDQPRATRQRSGLRVTKRGG